MLRCPTCKGEKGRDEGTEAAGDLRWIICVTCSGTGEVAELPDAPPPLADDIPPHPLADRDEDDLWMGLLRDVYQKVLYRLPRGPDAFESLFINHMPPIMERLYFEEEVRVDHDDLTSQRIMARIVLHRILPAGAPTGSAQQQLEWRNSKIDYHPHGCPSSVHLLEGGYEHKTGTNAGPRLSTRLSAGSQYAMTDPRVWHSIQAWEPTYTLMVQGPDWPRGVREEPVESPPHLEPLSEGQKLHLWWQFCRIFGVQPDDSAMQENR